jgi:hypothetical protein
MLSHDSREPQCTPLLQSNMKYFPPRLWDQVRPGGEEEEERPVVSTCLVAHSLTLSTGTIHRPGSVSARSQLGSLPSPGATQFPHV